MPVNFHKDEESVETLRKTLFGEKVSYSINAHLLNRNGKAEGSLVGGNFYADSVSLSGSGEGYGAEGEKNIYPPVAF